jgi:hypothetical protein
MPLLSSYNRFTCLEVDTLIESHTCVAKSTEVVQTHSYPPIPNQCSCLPAWECRLPVKYIVAASPGPMSLVVEVEIESTDTMVKRCTQAVMKVTSPFSFAIHLQPVTTLTLMDTEQT